MAKGEAYALNVSLIRKCCDPSRSPVSAISTGTPALAMGKHVSACVSYCRHVFAKTSLSDEAVGGILLAISLAVLIGCLIAIVRLLHSLLQGHMAKAIRKFVNNDLPGIFAPFTGYLAIVVGMALTILVQSSSVVTSSLTPLVGVGVLSLERMYPLTLGSNLGTTFTSILAAMASTPDHLASALQIAFVHLFFNLSGILLFFPIPFMRQLPIGLAQKLGNTTAKYRWFAVAYVILMFFIAPATVFGLSLAGVEILIGIGFPILLTSVAVVAVNVLQNKRPKLLPDWLKNWNWLPKWMHSLKPWDNVVTALIACCSNCFKRHKSPAFAQKESSRQLVEEDLSWTSLGDREDTQISGKETTV